MIKLNSLNKYFNKGKQNEIHVINDVSLELPESGIVAVFGRSGCGKTTLLNVIGGLDSVESGSITIDGESINQNTDALRNKYIGYIFQNYNLHVGETCFENVANALRLCGVSDTETIKRKVMAALRNVGLEQYAARTPDTLSGGQQQRIAIARAIVKNPRIILADEPTGNLDEANTVLVMDLLKEISRDHLVLLVTHEANLVDLYCDKVIELSDGKVVSIRDNEQTQGYTERGRNDIYLGELAQSTLTADGLNVRIYGEAPEATVNITLVNDNGRVYLRIDTPKIQLLDDYSEVKLHEGVYEARETVRQRAEKIDMSELGCIEGEIMGRLFTARGAVKSGYAANFKKGKRGKKLLRRCLCLFAAVIVVMSGVFGVSFKQLFDVESSYNHNVFYVYTPSGDISSRLLSAIDAPDSAIDYVHLDYAMPTGDSNVRFLPGSFETFDTSANLDAFGANGVFLDVALAEDMSLLAGKKDKLEDREVVLTSAVADKLIEKSSLGYIDGYDDVIGMVMRRVNYHSSIGSMSVAGVVKSDETAIYMSERVISDQIIKASGLNVRRASDNGFEASDGRVIYLTRREDKDMPKLGESIKIQGTDVKIEKVICQSSYSEWLERNGKNVKLPTTDGNYYEDIERYLIYFDEYINERKLFMTEDNIDIWLYTQKGIKEAKYPLIGSENFNPSEYFYAEKYKSEHGAYPTREYVEKHMMSNGTVEFITMLQKYRELYEQEFYKSFNYNFGAYFDDMYYVSDSDYSTFARKSGENHKTVQGYGTGGYYYTEYGSKDIVDIGFGANAEILVESVGGATPYSVVHSSDPRKTAEYLEQNFSDIKVNDEYYKAILTPFDIYERTIGESRGSIIASIVSMVVLLCVMSVCMYFIMRSSLMSRIKEVGIYRAIGVTKKNLVFKFFMEALVLTTLTVFIGYIATSGFLFACLGISPFMESLIYYPAWLALSVLGVIYAVCLFFGTLPINMLLRNTPSEILSKYDI